MTSASAQSFRVSSTTSTPGFAVSRVAELRARSGAGFNTYIETQLLDTRRRFRSQRDALFACIDFLWNTDFHLFLFSHQRRRPGGVTRWIMTART